MSFFSFIKNEEKPATRNIAIYHNGEFIGFVTLAGMERIVGSLFYERGYELKVFDEWSELKC